MNEDIFGMYESLNQSAVGKHLLEWTQKQHDSLIDKAEKCTNPEEAFGYLKEAYGIISVNQHIRNMSVHKK